MRAKGQSAHCGSRCARSIDSVRSAVRASTDRPAAGTIAAMRDADTPPQEPADRPRPRTGLTPRNQAALIRAAAAEVHERVQEWRDTPGWQDTPTNAQRHQATVAAVAALDALPDPVVAEELTELVDAIRPLLVEWRPSRPGSEQHVFAAVERLRRTCR